jgi:4-hydroxy-tetrahydrodipicolinate synthase
MRPEALKEFLMKGTIVEILMTPFTKDEELDVEGLRENIRYLVEVFKGEPVALTPCGSLSEFYAMSEEEIKKVIKITVEEVGGKLPVIAGTGAAGTKLAINLSKYAEDVGVDGVQVVLPYYHTPEELGMYLHYKKIAESLNIGVVIYNNPYVSKAYIKPPLMKKIVNDIPNIVGVKENTPFIDTFYQQVKAVGHKIPIIQGRGEWWYVATLPYGARGFVSGLNFMPKFSLELLKAGVSGDWKKAHELIKKLEPLDEFIARMREKYGPPTSILQPPYTTSYIYMSVRKAAMDILGLRGGSMRLPLINLKDEDKEELKKILLEGLGLKSIR